MHHLFFTAIPHYNLPKATAALRTFLQSKGLLNLHQRKKQHDFMFEVFRALYTFSFLAHKPTPEQLAESRAIFPDKKGRVKQQ